MMEMKEYTYCKNENKTAFNKLQEKDAQIHS